MEPTPIVVKGTDVILGYACARCHRATLVAKQGTEKQRKDCRDFVQACCQTRCCNVNCNSLIVGGPWIHPNQYCSSCSEFYDEEKEQNRFNKAERVSLEAMEYVFVDATEEIVAVSELLDHCVEHDIRPKYVWSTKRVDFSLSAEFIVEVETENFSDEDSTVDISDKHIRRLQLYLDLWVKRAKVAPYYECSYKQVVVLDDDFLKSLDDEMIDI